MRYRLGFDLWLAHPEALGSHGRQCLIYLGLNVLRWDRRVARVDLAYGLLEYPPTDGLLDKEAATWSLRIVGWQYEEVHTSMRDAGWYLAIFQRFDSTPG